MMEIIPFYGSIHAVSGETIKMNPKMLNFCEWCLLLDSGGISQRNWLSPTRNTKGFLVTWYKEDSIS